MSPQDGPWPVILFGYESSPFTSKVRLALRLKNIRYEFLTVPSMMPRPFLKDTFGLTYRRIPVCVIGHELYCDTSIILEALEHFFPERLGYRSLYPSAADGRTYRPLIRGFASYWTDRPLYRVTTGLIPGVVWRTSFGVDRSNLIGHTLDAEKLEKKVLQNLSGLDLQLSMLEPLFEETTGTWIFSSETPSMADAMLYYQLKWGKDIASGRLIENLTAGGTKDIELEGTRSVFNKERYPSLCTWFEEFKNYVQKLPVVENKITEHEALLSLKTNSEVRNIGQVPVPLLPTPAPPHVILDNESGLMPGSKVSVAPDDTGRADPTIGTLLDLTPEEVVIQPYAHNGTVPIFTMRFHFPRLGFVVRPTEQAKF